MRVRRTMDDLGSSHAASLCEVRRSLDSSSLRSQRGTGQQPTLAVVSVKDDLVRVMCVTSSDVGDTVV